MGEHEIDVEYLYGRVFRRSVRKLRWTCCCGLYGHWRLPGLGDAFVLRADYDLTHQATKESVDG